MVGTAHVLDACRANPSLERVVLTSTSEVYGTAQFVPITESHPLRGQSPYAATKIGEEAVPFIVPTLKTKDSVFNRLYVKAWTNFPSVLQQ